MRIDIEFLGSEPTPDWQDTPAPVRTLCACGAEIAYGPRESIATVVLRHNRTTQHAEWWAALERRREAEA